MKSLKLSTSSGGPSFEQVEGTGDDDTETVADNPVEPTVVTEEGQVDPDQVASPSGTRALLRNVLDNMFSTPAPGPAPAVPAPSPAAVPAATPMATSPDVTPATPTMGGLSQLTKNESSAWTGGQPKFDWSGLEGNPQSYTNPKVASFICRRGAEELQPSQGRPADQVLAQ
jgi:hypothetical protein